MAAAAVSIALMQEIDLMNRQPIIFAIAALLVSGAFASAQTPSRDLPDAANPSSASPAPNNASTGSSDRPAAATMPDANTPAPSATGQAPATSEKMQPEMDSVGGGKTAPGKEKK